MGTVKLGRGQYCNPVWFVVTTSKYMHDWQEVEPTLAAFVMAGQGVHRGEPGDEEYVPTGQSAQEVELAKEDEPAGQALQGEDLDTKIVPAVQ